MKGNDMLGSKRNEGVGLGWLGGERGKGFEFHVETMMIREG